MATSYLTMAEAFERLDEFPGERWRIEYDGKTLPDMTLRQRFGPDGGYMLWSIPTGEIHVQSTDVLTLHSIEPTVVTAANKYEAMADWEINREVGTRLGYKAVDLNDNPHGARVKGPNWVIVSPSGVNVNHQYSEADAWLHAVEWATEIDFALSTLVNNVAFQLGYVPDLAVWGAHFFLITLNGPMAFHKQPARATAVAWLLFQDMIAELSGRA